MWCKDDYRDNAKKTGAQNKAQTNGVKSKEMRAKDK
jgi:hypothetical protein